MYNKRFTRLFKNPEKIPISMSIGVVLIIIFILFNTGVLTKVPCEGTLHNIFASTFTHVELTHLLSNLCALYVLSRIEEDMGYKSFIWLLIFLLSFNILVVCFIRNILKDNKCSIGFSGILYGLMAWEIFSEKKISLDISVAILVLVFGPALQSKNISLRDHIIGVISGLIGGFIWSLIHKDK